MKRLLLPVAAAAVLLSPVPPVRADGATLTHGTTASTVQTISGEVVSISKRKRTITVMGAKGDTLEIVADKAVKNFDEIKKGDKLDVDVIASVVMTLTDPATKLTRTDSVNIEVPAKGERPKFGQVRVIDAVVEVVGIDRSARTMTLKGPRGRKETVQVGVDIKDFDKLTKGSKIRIQYTQATAVEIKKK